MGEPLEFVDILESRRNSSDVLWTMRPFHPLAAHKVPAALKYTRKQTIEAVLANPRVKMLIEALSEVRGIPPKHLTNEARGMLEEMAEGAHMPTIRCLGILVTKALKRILKSLHVNERIVLDLKAKMGTNEIQYVYVPTHRSYLDFIIVSYILFTFDMAVPNIASGMDFYRMQVVGEMLRKTGAFYMRRTFSTDQLYKEVFRAYIASIVAHSDRAIEFFIEGTRSRSQKTLAPKYGLLSMILEGLLKGHVPDIQFIPLSITYDRPLEEMLFVYELLGVPKPPESTTGLFKSLSILNDAQAYGNAYVNIGPPISGRQYFEHTALRASALSPRPKLPVETVKALAYAIIDSQKQHTPLSPFNLLAVLFNDRVHRLPENPYTLQTLLSDYIWLKGIFCRSSKALINPGKLTLENNSNVGDERTVLLESLFTHRELLAFNPAGELILVDRHKNANACDPSRVKGHALNDRTLRIAVPAINITIYSNPCMAFLAVPALVAVSIVHFGTTGAAVSKKYDIMRKLLINEFALDPSPSIAEKEWKDGLAFLVAEDCVRFEGDLLVAGSNSKLFSLLQTLMLPFIAAVYVTCTVLREWDVGRTGEPKESAILKETQRRMELMLFEGSRLVRYPYSLSLDLYTSTLASLISMGVFGTPVKMPSACYTPDRTKIDELIAELYDFRVLSPRGSYLDVDLSSPGEHVGLVQSKL